MHSYVNFVLTFTVCQPHDWDMWLVFGFIMLQLVFAVGEFLAAVPIWSANELLDFT